MSFHLFNEALERRENTPKEDIQEGEKFSVHTWERRKTPHVREREIIFREGRDQIYFASAQKSK